MQETNKQTNKQTPMERPRRQTSRLSHTSRWLHAGDGSCLLMQGQGAAVLLWLLSSLVSVGV